ncbi:MAG TPA: hypothetical protein PKA13_05865 [Geminicoccaceae bacterium]|nr:hypothetical protein [Geminicoccus sp.]HMU49281.1 hypothetical protein [Geminicoccaceae bacterium]
MSAGSWLVLAGLGAFHGLNPAMGWLFAVALGLHRHDRAIVLWSTLPIALGHALSIAAVLAVAAALGLVIDGWWLRRIAGAVLLGWALLHWLYGGRHRVRVGMQVGMAGLALWSFLMATAHGAGLMLLPVMLSNGGTGGHAHHAAPALTWGPSLAALVVHSGAMLATMLMVALLVYDWLGVAVLRHGWINLDLLWTLALVATGLALLLIV